MPYYNDPLAILQPQAALGVPGGALNPLLGGGPIPSPATAAPAQPQQPAAAPVDPSVLSGDARPAPLDAPVTPTPLSSLLSGIGALVRPAFATPAPAPRTFDDAPPAQPAPQAPPPAAPAAPQAPPADLPVPPVPPASPPPPAPSQGAAPGYLTDKAATQSAPQAAPQTPQSGDVPSQTPGGGAQPDFYATASMPRDPAMAQIVTQAAQKYNVPLQVAAWVGYHESGWNPTAVGPQTSHGRARGAWQFMDQTAKSVGLPDPTDFATSTDAAMRYLKQLHDQNGGDWTKAVQSYGTFSTGMGAQRDQMATKGFQTYMQGGSPGQADPSSPASPGQVAPGAVPQTASATGPSPQGAPSAQPEAPQDPTGFMQMLQQIRPSSSQQLQALAAGLLGNLNFGQGLGAGLQNMQGLDQQYRNLAVQAAQARAMAGYRQAMVGLGAARLQETAAHHQVQENEGQQGLDLKGLVPVQVQGPNGPMMVMVDKPQAAATGGTVLPGQTPQMMNAANNTARTNANISGDASMSREQGKDAADDLENITNTTQADAQALRENLETQKLIEANPQVMGPTMKAQAYRALATMGLSGDPNTIDALSKMTADQRMAYLQSATSGHVGAIRSNAELVNLSQAVAQLGTSPQAAQYILQMQRDQLQSRMAWRQQINQLQQTRPDDLNAKNYMNTKRQFFQNYFENNPLPSYGGAQAPQAPAAAPQAAQQQSQGAPTSPTAGTYKGVKWSFTPSNQG